MLAERVAGPLLLLVTARPELLDQRPGWARSAGTTVVRLEALPSAEAEQLIGALLGSDCPRPIRELVAERAEGNPFFVEELIATLADRGVLARRNGGWSFGELPPGFSVPDTVQAVLAARIDLLPRAEKAALQTAAVIGRVFWSGPVCELVPRERTRSSACSRSGTSCSARAGSSIDGPAGVRDQARAHPRGRLPEPAQGQAGAAARRLRPVARAERERRGRARAAAGAPLRRGRRSRRP